MTVHLFGGVWSASCANYGLQRTTQDIHGDFDPLTASTVARNFYIQDCLKSEETQETTVSLVCQLRELLQRGGFNLTSGFVTLDP